MDWRKHELTILIEHHQHHATDLRGTAIMFEGGDEEDRRDAAKFREFAELREQRISELQAELDALS